MDSRTSAPRLMMGGFHFVEIPVWVVCNGLDTMSRGRSMRDPPLSYILAIYEGTTPIHIIGAQTNTSDPTSFHLGTLIHILLQCCIVNLQSSLFSNAPPLLPLLFVVTIQQDQANRQARQACAQPQQLVVVSSVTPPAPMPNPKAATTLLSTPSVNCCHSLVCVCHRGLDNYILKTFPPRTRRQQVQ